MKKKKVRFNSKIMLEIFSRLDEMYRGRKGIYKYSILPEERQPAPSINFLFFTAMLMRWGVNSEPVYRAATVLYEHFPEIFEPKIVKDWQPEQIKRAFEGVSEFMLNGNSKGKNRAGVLGLHKEDHAQNWIYNANVLVRHWGGDPKNIFWGVTDFKEAFRRVNRRYNKDAGFGGIQMKIFSLFTQWLQEKDMIQKFPCPIPVDFHALRILWATNAISFREYEKPFDPKEKYPKQLAGKMAIRVYETHTDQVAIYTHNLMEKYGFLSEVISPALWFLSNILCARNLQNSTRDRPREDSRTTEIRFFEAKDLKKDPSLWPKRYKDPCIHCLIADLCKWAIPSAIYYHKNWGILMRLTRRIAYNRYGGIPRLDFANWPRIPFTTKIHSPHQDGSGPKPENEIKEDKQLRFFKEVGH